MQSALPVLIPFIAGQWSLLAAVQRGERDELGLNPLHCGAVVASMEISMILDVITPMS